MNSKLFDVEKLKNDIIESYYSRESEGDFIDLQSNAGELEIPFIEEFKGIIQKYKKNEKRKFTAARQFDNQIVEVEEIEELNENDGVIDIDALNEIESMVIRTLQYLNLELYESSKIKEFITGITLDDFEKKGLSQDMKNNIKNVIQNLVEHEFKELDNKKKFRRETLVRSGVTHFSEIIDDIITFRNNNSSGRMTKFQKVNFRNYIYKTIKDSHFEVYKKNEKMNYEETRFLDNLIRKIIVNKTNEL